MVRRGNAIALKHDTVYPSRKANFTIVVLIKKRFSKIVRALTFDSNKLIQFFDYELKTLP